MSLASDISPQPEHYSTKSYISSNIKKGIWVTKDGKIIPLSQLSESHKRNIERIFNIKLQRIQ